jgi:hypothetical protein
MDGTYMEIPVPTTGISMIMLRDNHSPYLLPPPGTLDKGSVATGSSKGVVSGDHRGGPLRKCVHPEFVRGVVLV